MYLRGLDFSSALKISNGRSTKNSNLEKKSDFKSGTSRDKMIYEAICDLRKNSNWFCWKKILQTLKYLDSKCGYFLFNSIGFTNCCPCPMRKISLATGEGHECKSGYTL